MEDNQKKEGIKGQTPNLVKDSQGLLKQYSWIWVPFIGRIGKLFMDEAHKSKFSIHAGATMMYIDLRKHYQWPAMKRDVAKYMEKCLTCLKVKVEHQKPQ